MKAILTIYLWMQVIFAALVILFGISYSIRCIVEHSGFVFVFLFGCLAYVGYKFLWTASIAELREHRAGQKQSNK